MAMGPIDQGGSGDGMGSFKPVSEINVTPLVDVMLVLLIIFMVAAPLMTVGVPVQLPKTQAAKLSQPKKPVVVSIDREGKVFLAEEPLAPGAITQRFATLAKDDPNAIVYVRGDKTVPYGRVMEVMGQVSSAGISKVSLIAEAAPATQR